MSRKRKARTSEKKSTLDRFREHCKRIEKDCPHYEDNQGFCHRCGVLMNEGAARDSGYFQEGMVEGELQF